MRLKKPRGWGELTRATLKHTCYRKNKLDNYVGNLILEFSFRRFDTAKIKF